MTQPLSPRKASETPRPGPTPSTEATRALRRILLSMSVIFLILVALGVHGFSLPYWHRIIDGSKATEVLVGEPRLFRWDDFILHLPLSLAQRAHDPPFPVVNENIGLGQNMLLPMPLPVAHFLTLFRPTQWGFFLGNDLGLAWMWWTRVLGLFAVWLLVFFVLTDGDLGLSAAGSALLVASPFFQFWSFNAAPVAMFMGISLLATLSIVMARNRLRILGSGFLLGWSGACFLLSLYPPFLVALGWLFLAVAGGLIWKQRQQLDLRPHLGTRAVALLCSLLIVGGAALTLYLEAGDAIFLLLNTDYPGSRSSTGGESSLWQLLNSNLGIALQVSPTGYGSLGNICEAASFWLLFPVTGAVVLRDWISKQASVDSVALLLLLYCLLLLIYCELGFPQALSRLSLFAWMPSRRALLGLGMADALLLIRLLSRQKAHGKKGPGANPFYFSLVGSWALVLCGCAYILHRELPESRPLWLGGIVVLNGVVAYFVLLRRRSSLVVAAMAMALALSSAWFNPLVRGGSDYLAENALSRAILEIDEQLDGQSTWIVYGSPSLGNLLPAIGVRALNGEHSVPQLELWARLDPSARSRRIFNRVANVQVDLPIVGRPRLEQQDEVNITWHLDPAGKELRALGVTHVLVRMNDRRYSGFSRYLPIAIHGGGPHYIYELPGGYGALTPRGAAEARRRPTDLPGAR